MLADALKSSFVADVADRLILAFHACNANKKYNYPTNILHINKDCYVTDNVSL